MGLQILADIYQIINQYNSKSIKQVFIHLVDENNRPSGTEVRILVPLELKVG